MALYPVQGEWSDNNSRQPGVLSGPARNNSEENAVIGSHCKTFLQITCTCNQPCQTKTRRIHPATLISWRSHCTAKVLNYWLRSSLFGHRRRVEKPLVIETKKQYKIETINHRSTAIIHNSYPELHIIIDPHLDGWCFHCSGWNVVVFLGQPSVPDFMKSGLWGQ